MLVTIPERSFKKDDYGKEVSDARSVKVVHDSCSRGMPRGTYFL
jgi:hypothetical protein